METLQTRLSRLNKAEIDRDYLPLRFSTFHREKQWTKRSFVNPSELWDEYDSVGWSFGIYAAEQLIGAVRLVPAMRPHDLPSWRFIPETHSSVGQVCEVSKVVVQPPWRQCGVFTALLLRCELEARTQGIGNAFICVRDSQRIRTLLSGEGFAVVGSNFRFEDTMIAPAEDAILLHKKIWTGDPRADQLEQRIHQLLSMIDQRQKSTDKVRDTSH